MKKLISNILLSLTVTLLSLNLIIPASAKTKEFKQIKPVKSDFIVSFPATATIEPLIKININPPVAGRIEKIMFKEGKIVKRGDILAYMSSTDRAALLDAAKAEGQKSLKKWENMYRPIALLSPISGKIVKKNIVAGQNITPQSDLFTIADKLIIKAQVDETDVGKVMLRQKVTVRADAFPNNKFMAKVVQIAHQSKLINNINIYEVILESDHMPKGLRSGMGASTNFTIFEKKDVLLLPAWMAEGRENSTQIITIQNSKGEITQRSIELGRSDGKMVEVKSNLNINDIVLYKPVKFTQKKKSILGL